MPTPEFPECGELSGQQSAQFFNALPCFSAGADHRESGVAVNPDQMLSRIQIALVHAQIHRNLLIARNGRHPVNEVRLRDGIDVGCKHHQCVNIGNRRADEVVFPGQDGFHHALSFFHSNFHHVSGKRGIALFSQDAPGAACHQSLRRLHIIEAADGAEDPPLCFLGHLVNSTFLVSRNSPLIYKS